ncbi:hypothetical protein O3M35_009752 [Rhynocoris fuscipes]|uniref:Odorant receptor n=1 Tax=Rhynocoris fuscipes TaxID=488301 RepID=A0AAW1D457_9HEMI
MGLIENLRSEDDATVDNYMMEEFWYLGTILYPKLNTKKWKIFSILQFLIYITLLLYHIAIFLFTAYKQIDNKIELFQNIHLAILLFIAGSIYIPIVTQRKLLTKFHRSLASGLSQYDDETEKLRIPKRKQIKKKNITVVIIALIYYIVLAILVIILSPYIDKYSKDSKDSNENVIYTSTGVSLNLPLKLWTPIGSDTLMKVVINAFEQGLIALIVVSIITSADIIYCNGCLSLKLEMDFLIISMKRLPKRTLKLYKLRYGSDIEFNEITNNKDLAECYKECLIQNISHHRNIIRAFNFIKDVAWVVLFLILTVGSAIIGLSGAAIVFNVDGPADWLLSAE